MLVVPSVSILKTTCALEKPYRSLDDFDIWLPVLSLPI
jgi:hypothetical protein